MKRVFPLAKYMIFLIKTVTGIAVQKITLLTKLKNGPISLDGREIFPNSDFRLIYVRLMPIVTRHTIDTTQTRLLTV